MNIQEFRKLTGLDNCSVETFEAFNAAYSALECNKFQFCEALKTIAMRYECSIAYPHIQQLKKEIARCETAIVRDRAEAREAINEGRYECARSCIRSAEEFEKELSEAKSALRDATGEL